MNEDFEKLDQLLRAGDFESLSRKDQQWIEESIGSAEAFDRLRETTIIARQENVENVRPQVKKDLMKQFKEKHQPGWKLVLQWKMPAYAAMLIVAVISTLLMTLMPEKERIVEIYIPQQPIIDTVFVVSEPDTVIIERTIERPVYVKVFEEEENIAPVVAVERIPKGKSLADQAGIKDILVSGR